MRKYHDELVDMAEKFNQFGGAPLPITFWFSKSGNEALADFESLLLQGRATLDRLTWYLSGYFKRFSSSSSFPSFSSFSDIDKLLKRTKHESAPRIREIIRQVDALKLSLIAPGNPNTLRDFVAHQAALKEIMENCFTVYYLGRNKAILTDCEAGVPIFKTSHALAIELPFVVLNSLAIIRGFETVARNDILLSWVLKTVVISEFVEEEPTGFVLNVTKRMTPSGFDVAARNVREKLFQFAIELNPGPDSFEFDLRRPA